MNFCKHLFAVCTCNNKDEQTPYWVNGHCNKCTYSTSNCKCINSYNQGHRHIENNQGHDPFIAQTN